MSSLTKTADEVHATPPPSKNRQNGNAVDSLLDDDEDILSPKKGLLDLIVRKSDNNFVASGDETDG
jgi:hypothetical protein